MNKAKEKIWSKGYFAQTMSSKEREYKKRTFHMKHNEDMNFNCKKCNTKISAHNEDWHDGMCDDCFDDQYFPEEAKIFETDLNEIKKAMEIEKKDNVSFWKWLKTDELDFERFNKIVKEIINKIDCIKCANCCKVLGMVFKESDIERISKYLDFTKEEFIQKYLTKDNENELKIKQLPCPFLKENKCQIYKLRPENCGDYPHLDKDITLKCHQFSSNAEICPILFNVLENAKEEFLEDIYAFENPDI